MALIYTIGIPSTFVAAQSNEFITNSIGTEIKSGMNVTQAGKPK